MLNIRQAVPDDLAEIMSIYRTARAFMIKTGNPNQWGNTHPPETLIREDIRQGICHVIYNSDGIQGVFALCSGEEPTYRTIEDGAWPNAEPYLTIHRIASGGRVHGVFACASDYAKRLSENVRIDTHHDNRVMQKLVLRNGFGRCGVIYLPNGSPRIAYAWCRENTENEE